MSEIKELHTQLNFGIKLQDLGWKELASQKVIRNSKNDVILKNIFTKIIYQLNENINIKFINQAINKFLEFQNNTLMAINYQLWKYMIEGIWIEDITNNNNFLIKLIDFENINNNDFTFIHEHKIKQTGYGKRPDTILYVNGLPLVVVEFKSPTDEHATLINAFKQIKTYQATISELFKYNLFAVISDGHTTRYGTISANWDRYMIWTKSNIDDKENKNPLSYQQDTFIKGLLNKITFMDILKNFTLFNNSNQKIIVAYHQYYAVKKAINAINNANDGKAGVVWHTQGSGKSYSMVFLSWQIRKFLPKATILVITDRNSLDDQLYDTFSNAIKYLNLPLAPKHIKNKIQLINELKDRKQGNIIFATIQKWDQKTGLLSSRDDIIVIVDEAHRSQYGLDSQFKIKSDKKAIYATFGYAKYLRVALPHARYIGFSATPIDNDDKSTYKVFGKCIDKYDMMQAVIDEATVPIKYEANIVQLDYQGQMINDISEIIEKMQNQYLDKTINKTIDNILNLATLIGNPQRLDALANKFYQHYQQRKNILFGKAIYVAYNRKIAFAMYQRIIKFPDLNDKVKIIVTHDTNQDSDEMLSVFGNKEARKEWITQFKNKDSNLKIIIVVDMLLTGFDMPILDVMYFDKPLRRHTLMQAIARVNRKYPNKEAGLIVDFIGLKKYLDEAIKQYVLATNNNKVTIEDINNVVKKLTADLNILNQLFLDFNRTNYFHANANEKYEMIKDAYEFILTTDANNKNDHEKLFDLFMKGSKDIEQSFKYACNVLDQQTHTQALFYITLRAFINKARFAHKIDIIKDFAKQLKIILANGIYSKDIVSITNINNNLTIDLFALQNFEQLNQEFKPRTLISMLNCSLNNKIKQLETTNLVQANNFKAKLDHLLKQYNDIATTNPETIVTKMKILNDEIINLAKIGMALGLNEREMAIYDVLNKQEFISNDFNASILINLSKQLFQVIKINATIDWSKNEATKRKMRKSIKLLLSNANYPLSKRNEVIKLIMLQAENFSSNSELDLIS